MVFNSDIKFFDCSRNKRFVCLNMLLFVPIRNVIDCNANRPRGRRGCWLWGVLEILRAGGFSVTFAKAQTAWFLIGDATGTSGIIAKIAPSSWQGFWARDARQCDSRCGNEWLHYSPIVSQIVQSDPRIVAGLPLEENLRV